MRRFAVLLLAVVLLAGCGMGSQSKGNEPQSAGAYVEMDWGSYQVMLADSIAKCPGPSFVDCKVRLYNGYQELHIRHPETGKPYWVPVVGMPIMGTPHK